MKRLVVMTGAGMSAESGIKTFRESGGLWEEYDVMTVASIEGWFKNPALVLDFYNKRRDQLKDCEPNAAHTELKELEKHFDVQIITQNIDNLHERAGSSHVLHLHGELTKAVSVANDSLVSDIGYNSIYLGDLASDGEQLRPFIVWFGEAVPLFEKAIAITKSADILVIIGTSMQVYPAAALINYAKKDVPVYLIDPNEVHNSRITKHIKKGAGEGVKEFIKIVSS